MSKPESQMLASQCSSEEWELRVQLAACYRAFVHYGWTDSIFTHLSARVPGQTNQYLINPYGLLFHEICASNLIKVDFDGNVVAGDYPYNEAGHAIHSAMLRARPDVNVALHSHTRAGMAVSCMDCGLLPLTQQSNEIRDLLCYHDYGIARTDSGECERLGADMVDKWIMIMRNHGLLTVGPTIGDAFLLMYALETGCQTQILAQSTAGDLQLVPQPVVDGIQAQVDDVLKGLGGQLVWPGLLRKLDRADSSFRD